MPQLGDFDVWIVVGGKKVEEYGVERSDKTDVSCYIPSELDQTFSIKLKNNFQEKVSFGVYVDGRYVNGTLCRKAKQCIVDGVDVSSTAYRPFKFGTLSVTDDDNAKEKSGWEDLGSIEVRVRRIYHEKSGARSTTQSYVHEVQDGAVHERSKKAGCHRVGLGDVQPRAAVHTVTVEFVDSEKEPYARFKFLYRPQSLLQAQGIMPPPEPEPVSDANSKQRIQREEETRPSASSDGLAGAGLEAHIIKREGDASHPTSKALIEKEDRLKALMAEAEQMRAELEAERSRVDVKREASPIRVPPSKKRRIFIDLTK